MLQHLLFAFLTIVAPALDFHATRRLKKNLGSVQRIGYYKNLCAWLWIRGVVGSAVAGFLFGLLFLLSGNLLLPIILHALVDLRALVILPTRTEPTSPLMNASNS